MRLPPYPDSMDLQRKDNNFGSVCSTSFNRNSGSSQGEVIARTSSKKCYCGQMVEARTAWTSKNFGRRFLGCPNFNKQGNYYCRFFQWDDELENNPNRNTTKINQLEERIKQLEVIVKQSVSKEERVVAKYRLCVAVLVASWVMFVVMYTKSC